MDLFQCCFRRDESRAREGRTQVAPEQHKRGRGLNEDLGIVGRLERLMQTVKTLTWKSEDDRG